MHLRAIATVRAVLAQRHHFNPLAANALNPCDTVEDLKQIRTFGYALEALLGITGTMTLAVGGMGVGA